MKEARAPRRQADRRRSAADRARGDGRRLPAAPAGHERRGLQRARARHRARRPLRPRLRRRAAPRPSRPTRSFIARLRPEARRVDHRRRRARLSSAAAHLYATNGPAAIFYGLGVTEQAQGVSGVRTLANLAILTGNLGKRRRRARTRCAARTTCRARATSARCRTTSRCTARLTDDATRHAFEAKWGGRPIQKERGLMIPEMFERGHRRASSRRCTSSARTSRRPIPNVHHVEEALKALELLVVHDIFENVTRALRARDAARLELPREDRHVHQRRAPHPDGARGGAAARRGAARSRHPARSVGAPRLPDAARDAGRRDGRDRRAHARSWAGVSHERLGNAGPPVAGPRRRTTPARRSSTSRSFATTSGRADALRASTGSRPARARASASRSSSSPAGSSRTTTRARRRGAPATSSSSRADLVEVHPTDAARLGVADGRPRRGRERARHGRRRGRASRRASRRATSSSRSTSPR